MEKIMVIIASALGPFLLLLFLTIVAVDILTQWETNRLSRERFVKRRRIKKAGRADSFFSWIDRKLEAAQKIFYEYEKRHNESRRLAAVKKVKVKKIHMYI